MERPGDCGLFKEYRVTRDAAVYADRERGSGLFLKKERKHTEKYPEVSLSVPGDRITVKYFFRPVTVKPSQGRSKQACSAQTECRPLSDGGEESGATEVLGERK